MRNRSSKRCEPLTGFTDFGSLFGAAFSGRASPFAWQLALAEGPWPEILIAPTGSGKTAGVTLAWMHHTLQRPTSTPRRLVWCLPMRTIVDQTVAEVRRWVQRVDEAGVDPDGLLPRSRDVHVLMGGVDSGAWLEAPERPSIIVGTQDMLLSRALMRGYASSRALWPMEFAMLHQDVQWVFDEVQLMGAGRATSAQLEAFRRYEFRRSADGRRSVGRSCRSLWISATLEPEWLKTVDYPAPIEVLRVDPKLDTDTKLLDLARAAKHLRRRVEIKPNEVESKSATAQHEREYLERLEREYLARLAEAVVDAHHEGYMTLVIVNQVRRAQEVYRRVRKILATRQGYRPELALLHSRFRPADREREMVKIPKAGAPSDIIVIATQAVEAGVDISAAVMFTELAPWASMVQRFGRANRRAEVEGGAQVYWIDILGLFDVDDKKFSRRAAKWSLPYGADELREAREKLSDLADAAPVHLPPADKIDPPLRIVRRKDLGDLFDTDADLTGFDVDISPYVRDADDTDIRVFWRELPASADEPPTPSACELCAVPIGLAKTWIKATRKVLGSVIFVRDPQWRRGKGQPDSNPPPGWRRLRVREREPWPGLTLLADVRAGGYREDLGFTGDWKHIPIAVDPRESAAADHGLGDASDGHDDDPQSEIGRPIPLTDHLRHVAREVSALCEALRLDEATRELLTRAARWHDLGKAHEAFQDTMRQGLDGQSVPEDVFLAKTVKGVRHRKRAYFRHELASALAFLAYEGWSRDADLGAFLIAAHHGKVRMNLRALPRESVPKEQTVLRFARGIWEGDELPALDLGEGDAWQGGNLTLSVMELGWDDATKESWTERTRELLARFGPFQLAWLETLLRIADWRASRKEVSGGYDDA